MALHQETIFTRMDCLLRRLRWTLEELRRHTVMLLQLVDSAPDTIDAWMESEGFGFDEAGYFTSLPRQRAYRAKEPDSDLLSFYWPAQMAEDPEAKFQTYALRDIGPVLKALRADIPGVDYIYFQGRTNIAITHPYVDSVHCVPPDFTWDEYDSYRSVVSEVNPDRTIRWAWPADDVAGLGTHGIISIPVYVRDAFVGLWSMDVPMEFLCESIRKDRALANLDVFIGDVASGKLIYHKTLGPRINRADRCIYWSNLQELGGDFATIDPEALAAGGETEIDLTDGQGQALKVRVMPLPEIEWLLFSCFPRSLLTEAIASEVTSAFRRIGEGDLSHRLEATEDAAFKPLIEEYNRMVARLERTDKQRQKAERAQRECELRYGSFEQLSPVGIFRANTLGHYLHVNRRWAEITGCTPGKATGRGWLDALHPADRERVEAAWRNAVTQHEPFWAEYRVGRGKENVKWVLSEAVVIGNVRKEIIGYIGTLTDISAQKQLQAEVVEASSREQQRIGHELHDNLGQLLTGALYMSHALAGKLDREGSGDAAALKDTIKVMHQALVTTRGIARGLAPMSAGKTNLKESMEDLITSAAELFHVDCHLAFDAPCITDDKTILHLYRIAQESINNAVRHGKAHRISIHVTGSDGALTMAVQSDGRGMPSDWRESAGQGIRIMRHRAGVLGGSLAFESPADGGVRVVCRVPHRQG